MEFRKKGIKWWKLPKCFIKTCEFRIKLKSFFHECVLDFKVKQEESQRKFPLFSEKIQSLKSSHLHPFHSEDGKKAEQYQSTSIDFPFSTLSHIFLKPAFTLFIVPRSFIIIKKESNIPHSWVVDGLFMRFVYIRMLAILNIYAHTHFITNNLFIIMSLII